MADLIISCLSQKGGVGKSTLARLIATSYAAHDQRVGIMDFNGAQETSVFWANLRANNHVEPKIHAEVATQANRMRNDARFDVIVADGRPDSPDVTLSIAKVSDLIVVPTSFTVDDLVPQKRFALELVNRGIDEKRILFVINRIVDHDDLTKDAIAFIKPFAAVETALPYRTSFVRAHILGLSVGEVKDAVLGKTDNLVRLTRNVAESIAIRAMEIAQ